MSQVWFTADTHFGHRNIIKYCHRPFMSAAEQELVETNPRGGWRISDETVQKHDDALIDTINSLVAKNDRLWILGDFCWGGLSAAQNYVDRIVCSEVNLVWGNHDNREIGPVFCKTIEQGRIKVGGQQIWLNHYPMRSWDGRFHGTWHLYGHVHNRFSEDDAARPTMLTRDVGVDACDYRPISFDQLHEYMKPRMAAFEKAKQQGGAMLD